MNDWDEQKKFIEIIREKKGYLILTSILHK